MAEQGLAQIVVNGLKRTSVFGNNATNEQVEAIPKLISVTVNDIIVDTSSLNVALSENASYELSLVDTTDGELENIVVPAVAVDGSFNLSFDISANQNWILREGEVVSLNLLIKDGGNVVSDILNIDVTIDVTANDDSFITLTEDQLSAKVGDDYTNSELKKNINSLVGVYQLPIGEIEISNSVTYPNLLDGNVSNPGNYNGTIEASALKSTWESSISSAPGSSKIVVNLVDATGTVRYKAQYAITVQVDLASLSLGYKNDYSLYSEDGTQAIYKATGEVYSQEITASSAELATLFTDNILVDVSSNEGDYYPDLSLGELSTKIDSDTANGVTFYFVDFDTSGDLVTLMKYVDLSNSSLTEVLQLPAIKVFGNKGILDVSNNNSIVDAVENAELESHTHDFIVSIKNSDDSNVGIDTVNLSFSRARYLSYTGAFVDMSLDTDYTTTYNSTDKEFTVSVLLSGNRDVDMVLVLKDTQGYSYNANLQVTINNNIDSQLTAGSPNAVFDWNTTGGEQNGQKIGFYEFPSVEELLKLKNYSYIDAGESGRTFAYNSVDFANNVKFLSVIANNGSEDLSLVVLSEGVAYNDLSLQSLNYDVSYNEQNDAYIAALSSSGSITVTYYTINSDGKRSSDYTLVFDSDDFEAPIRTATYFAQGNQAKSSDEGIVTLAPVSGVSNNGSAYVYTTKTAADIKAEMIQQLVDASFTYLNDQGVYEDISSSHLDLKFVETTTTGIKAVYSYLSEPNFFDRTNVNAEITVNVSYTDTVVGNDNVTYGRVTIEGNLDRSDYDKVGINNIKSVITNSNNFVTSGNGLYTIDEWNNLERYLPIVNPFDSLLVYFNKNYEGEVTNVELPEENLDSKVIIGNGSVSTVRTIDDIKYYRFAMATGNSLLPYALVFYAENISGEEKYMTLETTITGDLGTTIEYDVRLSLFTGQDYVDQSNTVDFTEFGDPELKRDNGYRYAVIPAGGKIKFVYEKLVDMTGLNLADTTLSVKVGSLQISSSIQTLPYNTNYTNTVKSTPEVTNETSITDATDYDVSVNSTTYGNSHAVTYSLVPNDSAPVSSGYIFQVDAVQDIVAVQALTYDVDITYTSNSVRGYDESNTDYISTNGYTVSLTNVSGGLLADGASYSQTDGSVSTDATGSGTTGTYYVSHDGSSVSDGVQTVSQTASPVGYTWNAFVPATFDFSDTNKKLVTGLTGPFSDSYEYYQSAAIGDVFPSSKNEGSITASTFATDNGSDLSKYTYNVYAGAGESVFFEQTTSYLYEGQDSVTFTRTYNFGTITFNNSGILNGSDSTSKTIGSVSASYTATRTNPEFRYRTVIDNAEYTNVAVNLSAPDYDIELYKLLGDGVTDSNSPLIKYWNGTYGATYPVTHVQVYLRNIISAVSTEPYYGTVSVQFYDANGTPIGSETPAQRNEDNSQRKISDIISTKTTRVTIASAKFTFENPIENDHIDDYDTSVNINIVGSEDAPVITQLVTQDTTESSGTLTLEGTVFDISDNDYTAGNITFTLKSGSYAYPNYPTDLSSVPQTGDITEVSLTYPGYYIFDITATDDVNNEGMLTNAILKVIDASTNTVTLPSDQTNLNIQSPSTISLDASGDTALAQTVAGLINASRTVTGTKFADYNTGLTAAAVFATTSVTTIGGIANDVPGSYTVTYPVGVAIEANGLYTVTGNNLTDVSIKVTDTTEHTITMPSTQSISLNGTLSLDATGNTTIGGYIAAAINAAAATSNTSVTGTKFAEYNTGADANARLTSSSVSALSDVTNDVPGDYDITYTKYTMPTLPLFTVTGNTTTTIDVTVSDPTSHNITMPISQSINLDDTLSLDATGDTPIAQLIAADINAAASVSGTKFANYNTGTDADARLTSSSVSALSDVTNDVPGDYDITYTAYVQPESSTLFTIDGNTDTVIDVTVSDSATHTVTIPADQDKELGNALDLDASGDTPLAGLIADAINAAASVSGVKLAAYLDGADAAAKLAETSVNSFADVVSDGSIPCNYSITYSDYSAPSLLLGLINIFQTTGSITAKVTDSSTQSITYPSDTQIVLQVGDVISNQFDVSGSGSLGDDLVQTVTTDLSNSYVLSNYYSGQNVNARLEQSSVTGTKDAITTAVPGYFKILYTFTAPQSDLVTGIASSSTHTLEVKVVDTELPSLVIKNSSGADITNPTGDGITVVPSTADLSLSVVDNGGVSVNNYAVVTQVQKLDNSSGSNVLSTVYTLSDALQSQDLVDSLNPGVITIDVTNYTNGTNVSELETVEILVDGSKTGLAVELENVNLLSGNGPALSSYAANGNASYIITVQPMNVEGKFVAMGKPEVILVQNSGPSLGLAEQTAYAGTTPAYADVTNVVDAPAGQTPAAPQRFSLSQFF